MGTPEIGSYALKALLDNNAFDVKTVICQPDKVSGRKKEVEFSPVKKMAIENNLTIYQPNKLGEISNELENLSPDLFVTCAYGKFIPEKILQIPKYGCINAHASILPKYRGGAPIHWAVINGEISTGVTLMKTIKEMDAGDYFIDYKIMIEESDNTSTLFKKMNDVVYKIIYEQLENIVMGKLKPIKQDESKVSFALNIKREQEKLNLNLNANSFKNWVRGLADKPGGYLFYKNKSIKIFLCEITNIPSQGEVGKIVDIKKDGIYINTLDFVIKIVEFQIEGKNRINIKNFSSNSFFVIGERFE
ncbi:methionyl-tRNA formyltransferase [Malacoplasma iowae DK-CPA]|uniref:Methionyl-tRNA formyltransferase n=2 Tax=Malacoplasma iowae TaxID=2116 RepID=A0A084U2V0_MALIO|nr:methionyl-tRNA formyltransferase [Malacoplasma iowae DK-CPA]